MSEPNPYEFRNALGQFATGVTIVTTIDSQAKPVGVTASSFNSVSLDPPLVLWSLAKTAHSMPAYQNAGGFNVHVLASHQSNLSNQFARPADDKFSGVDWSLCEQGFPLLPEYAALFSCKTQMQRFLHVYCAKAGSNMIKTIFTLVIAGAKHLLNCSPTPKRWRNNSSNISQMTSWREPVIFLKNSLISRDRIFLNYGRLEP